MRLVERGPWLVALAVAASFACGGTPTRESVAWRSHPPTPAVSVSLAHGPSLGFWEIPLNDRMVIRDGIGCVPQIPRFYLRASGAVIFDQGCQPDRRTFRGDRCEFYVGVSVEWRGQDLFHWDPDRGWKYLATSDGDGFHRREECFGTTLSFRFEHSDEARPNPAQRRFQEYDGPVY